MKEIISEIENNWKDIRNAGAFIFDLDETLISADRPLSETPELVQTLLSLLERGVWIALISGSPGAVVKNRVMEPFFGAGANKKNFETLVIYANGGGSKFPGGGEEDEAYTKKNLIGMDAVNRVRDKIESYVRNRFGLEAGPFGKLVEIWKEKRSKQWGKSKIEFNDDWMNGAVWSIAFFDDREMADVKAGKAAGKISYPFINTRGAVRDEDGKLTGVTGFTPSGFYDTAAELGFDVRDLVIEWLERDLKNEVAQLAIRKSGRSSMDITKQGTDKAAALKDFIRSTNRKTEYVYYFGDEFYPGGNDQPIADDAELKESGLRILSIHPDREPAHGHVRWINGGVNAVPKLLKDIAEKIR